MTDEAAERLTGAVTQALRDVFENEFGGVLSIHWNGTLGLTPIDAAARLATPLTVQMDHHGIVFAHERSAGAARMDVAIRRICNVLDNDEGGAELYEAALELYRARLSEGTDR